MQRLATLLLTACFLSVALGACGPQLSETSPEESSKLSPSDASPALPTVAVTPTSTPTPTPTPSPTATPTKTPIPTSTPLPQPAAISECDEMQIEVLDRPGEGGVVTTLGDTVLTLTWRVRNDSKKEACDWGEKGLEAQTLVARERVGVDFAASLAWVRDGVYDLTMEFDPRHLAYGDRAYGWSLVAPSTGQLEAAQPLTVTLQLGPTPTPTSTPTMTPAAEATPQTATEPARSGGLVLLSPIDVACDGKYDKQDARADNCMSCWSYPMPLPEGWSFELRVGPLWMYDYYSLRTRDLCLSNDDCWPVFRHEPGRDQYWEVLVLDENDEVVERARFAPCAQ